MNQTLINRYKNIVMGIFSKENSKFTLIHFFDGKYYINEPVRLQSGKLTNLPANWKIFNEKQFEKYIEHYESQLIDRIEHTGG